MARDAAGVGRELAAVFPTSNEPTTRIARPVRSLSPDPPIGRFGELKSGVGGWVAGAVARVGFVVVVGGLGGASIVA